MEHPDVSQSHQTCGDFRSTPPAGIAEASPLPTPPPSQPELQTARVPPPLEKHHTEFASFEEGYIARYIALADTKASFVFAGASAVLVYLVNNDEIRSAALNPAWTPDCALLGVALFFLSVAGLFAFSTIVPRLTASGEGIVFFGAVAAHPSARGYRAAVAKLSEAELSDARLIHCYDLAKVCQRKYCALQRSMWMLLPGVTAAACVSLLAS
jgi:hypothetical protein